MRDQYHEELDGILARLGEMTQCVGTAINQATQALLDADLSMAETVISADEAIDTAYSEIEERAFDLMARQQPVASDLRFLVTSLRISSDIERMGDLALHVAKVARRRYPAHAIPDEMRSTVLEMGQVAQRIVTKLGTVVSRKEIALAAELERDDDLMDDLHRRLFTIILAPGWNGRIEEVIDVTLCGRYYERFCDHAVSVARRIIYLVTGERVPAEGSSGAVPSVLP